jgi:hypothetical protein
MAYRTKIKCVGLFGEMIVEASVIVRFGRFQQKSEGI